MSMKKIIPLAFLEVLICIGIVFLPIMFSTTDEATVSSDYEAQYDSGTDIIILVLVILKFVAILIALLIMVLSLASFKKIKF